MPQTKENVYQKTARAMTLLSRVGVAKNQVNTYDKYRFRGIDDLYNVLGPVLAEVGLAVLPSVRTREVKSAPTAKGGQQYHVTLGVDYALISVDDGSERKLFVYGEAMDRGDKATAKAMSAAYKSFCLQAFCIPVEGDDDADHGSPEVEVEMITPEQAKELKELLAAQKAPEDQFMKALNLEGVLLGHLPADKYAAAKKKIEERAKKVKEAQNGNS